MKKNSFPLGVIIGLICPLIGIVIFYFLKASGTPFDYFLQIMWQNKSLLTAAVSFSLFINAVVFTITVNKGIDKTAKGVFLVTLLITIPAIIYKLFF